jgi:membrane-associated phospholipid phosphatase
MWYDAPFNATIIKAVQSISNPFFDALFTGFTLVGEETFFMIFAVLVYWCLNKKLGYRMGLSYLTGVFVNTAIKELLRVPRPIGEPGIRSLRVETAYGYSFPSGHSENATIIIMQLMRYFKKLWMTVLGIIVILMVALSRIYLGVHRPIDVLAGIAIGIVWVIVSNIVFDYSEKSGRKYVMLLLILPVCILNFIGNYPEGYKALGTLIAFYVGYLIEPKFIRYQTQSKLLLQILKAAIGIGVLFALKELLKRVLPASDISDFCRYFIMGAWVTMIGPWLWMRISKAKPDLGSE